MQRGAGDGAAQSIDAAAPEMLIDAAATATNVPEPVAASPTAAANDNESSVSSAVADALSEAASMTVVTKSSSAVAIEHATLTDDVSEPLAQGNADEETAAKSTATTTTATTTNSSETKKAKSKEGKRHAVALLAD